MAEYRKLAGPKPRRWTKDSMFGNPFSVRSSLWLGQDHLLHVHATAYTESYRRFYFRDIQAITIRSNGRRAFWNAVLGVLLLLYIAAFAYFGSPLSDTTMIVGSLFAVVFFIAPLAGNNLLGPACVCTLRTAVQTEELTSLGRVWRARKILARIRPAIAAAQGELSREEIAAGIEKMEAALRSKRTAPAPRIIPLADSSAPAEPSGEATAE